MHELEAKFLTDDGGSPTDVLRRLQRNLIGAGYRIEPRGRSAFTDRYFDTVDHRLRAAGWSYREREDALGRRAALKEISRSRAAIFERQEIEQPIGVDETLATLGPGPVQERLSNLLHPEAEVAPLLRIRSERDAYALEHPAHPRGLVEMAFDQTRVEAPDPVEFQELALELKIGPHELLAELLSTVECEPSLIEARLSPFERGLLALGHSLERRRGLEPKPLDRRARWLDLGLVQLRAQLQRIRLYEPHAWEGLHPEGTRRLRVAVRRAHTAVRTFAEALPAQQADDVAAGLRWIGGIVGRVDDLTVQISRLDAYARGEDRNHRITLERYRRHLRHRRQAAQRELRAALASANSTDLLAAFQRLLADTARPDSTVQARIEEMAGPAVVPLLERVRRRHDPLAEQATGVGWRGLYEDVLRLLDRLEFLERAYAAEAASALPLLRRLANRLRALQNASDARTQMRRYRDVHLTRQPPRALFNHLMRLEERRAERQRRRLAEDWRRFDGAAAELRTRFA